MSLEKRLTNDRLERRKRAIETMLFDALSNIDCSKETSTSAPVWVDGNVLIRFFSCLDGMDDTLQNRPLLQHRELLCNHGSGGLHPRVAKGGKLLPRNVYKIIVSLLRDEQIQFCSGNGTEKSSTRENRDDDVSDCVISPSSHLFCHECVETYRCELAEKEKSLSLVLKLHDAFDSKINDFEPKFLPERQDVYAISKHFVTTFKKQAERVMKESTSPQVVCEGIDLLDLSFLPAFRADAPSLVKPEATEEAAEAAAGGGEVLDPLVNGKITCKY